MDDDISFFFTTVQNLLQPLLSTQRTSWEQGVGAIALLETHLFVSTLPGSVDSDIARTLNPLSLVYHFAHDAVIRQAPDGRLGVVLNGDGSSDKSALDPACIGECLFFLSLRPDSEHQSLGPAVNSMLLFILNECPKIPVQDPTSQFQDAFIYSHRMDAQQIWSDSIFMLPPFLTSAAIFHSHDRTFDLPMMLLRQALSQIILPYRVLHAPTLEWRHIYDFTERSATGPELWGVGNGWACGGIVRTFLILARSIETGPHYHLHDSVLQDPEIIASLQKCYQILMDTLNACILHMRPDGLYHNILDDPTTFVETNLSQQLAYTIYRLLDLHAHYSHRVLQNLHITPLGHVQSQALEEHADTMFVASTRKVDQWGYVRDVCGSPNFDGPGTAAEGQAWGILMNVAREEYKIHQRQSHGSVAVRAQ